MADTAPHAAQGAQADPAALEAARPRIEALREGLQSRFFGQDDLVEQLMAAFIADGHVLLEGAPGLGKTRLLRSFAGLLGLDYGRVQCTPDLMPSDITGSEILAPDGKSFQFLRGPVFCQVLLADEINRATPRTQSALLEAMEERQVTAGGETHALPRPFFTAATQNPLEWEGTYPLPEAQLDRFLFKLEVHPPEVDTLQRIFELPAAVDEAPLAPVCNEAQALELQALARTLVVPEGMLRRLAEVLRATDPEAAEAPAAVREAVQWGASPRGGRAALAGARALAMIRGRAHVAPQDLRDAVFPALRHRVFLRYEAQAAGTRPDRILSEILQRFPVE